MSRFDVDRFQIPPDAELICCICQGVLDQPKETPCRHVFCKVCIETWLQKHRTCPTCRGFTGKDQLQNVLPLLQNMINRLRIRCGNYGHGCTESWTTEHFPEVHDDFCTFKMIKCMHRLCNHQVIRKNLAAHETKCEFAEMTCERICGLTVLVRKYKSHSCVEALKQKVQQQQEIIQDLQNELKTLREQLQRQDDWDDDYYSDDNSDWGDWSDGEGSSHSYNQSNDQDSMVGFSESSGPYNPWSPEYRPTQSNYDSVRRTPPDGYDWPPFESEEAAQTPEPETGYYSPSDAEMQSNASNYSATFSGLNIAYSPSYHRDDSRSDQEQRDSAASDTDSHHSNDLHSSPSEQRNSVSSYRSSSLGTVMSSDGESRKRKRSSASRDAAHSDTGSNSSSGRNRSHGHGKFSHVNTSSDSSESDTCDNNVFSGSTSSGRSPASKSSNYCVSDEKVTSSGLYETEADGHSSASSGSGRGRKRKHRMNSSSASETESETSQRPSKKSRTVKSTKSKADGYSTPSSDGSSRGSKRSCGCDEASSCTCSLTQSDHSTTSDVHVEKSPTYQVRRSPRKPKPVKDKNSLMIFSPEASDSETDCSFKAPSEDPSDVTVSEEYFTSDMSDCHSDKELFETVDKLLDRYAQSDVSDGSWTPSH